MTPTRKQLGYWADLKHRKERDASGLFLAEGRKLADEVVAAGWTIEAWLNLGPSTDEGSVFELTREQMERVSGFRTASDVIAVVRKPWSLSAPRWVPGTWGLVLDGLQDPGNVGTLIRTAGWFGFSVYCTPDTADPYGPKAVQASMGALFHVPVATVDLGWFDELPEATPVYGADLEGDSVFEASLAAEGLVILGNEGHGIRAALRSRVARRLTVPRFGGPQDSLNVATAGAILMAEFRRRPS